MKCFTCKTEMKCYSDVNDISNRIDFVKCEKCGSRADIVYGNNGEFIEVVYWKR
jgi:hypothetical protein